MNFFPPLHEPLFAVQKQSDGGEEKDAPNAGVVWKPISNLGSD